MVTLGCCLCPVADMLCDLEQTFPLSGPELPELKCEKLLLPVVSNSGKSQAGGGALESSFLSPPPSHPTALTDFPLLSHQA